MLTPQNVAVGSLLINEEASTATVHFMAVNKPITLPIAQISVQLAGGYLLAVIQGSIYNITNAQISINGAKLTSNIAQKQIALSTAITNSAPEATTFKAIQTLSEAIAKNYGNKAWGNIYALISDVYVDKNHGLTAVLDSKDACLQRLILTYHETVVIDNVGTIVVHTIYSDWVESKNIPYHFRIKTIQVSNDWVLKTLMCQSTNLCSVKEMQNHEAALSSNDYKKYFKSSLNPTVITDALLAPQ